MLDYLRRDIRSRHPSISSHSSMLPSKPHSVGISQFFPVEKTVNNNLPLSPAISQWLDVKTDILQGKGSLGKSQHTLPYAKGQYPKLPALSAGRYLPVDAGTFFSCPRVPPSWYQVCSTRGGGGGGGGGGGNPLHLAHQVSFKEAEELITFVGRNLAVISELDWLTSGGVTPLGPDGSISRSSSILVFHSVVAALFIGDMYECGNA